VKEYLSHGNRMVFVEWVEQKRGEWGPEHFGWIAEEDVQAGLSVFMEKYTPLKEEVLHNFICESINELKDTFESTSWYPR
jgi:hypothetical protein